MCVVALFITKQDLFFSENNGQYRYDNIFLAFTFKILIRIFFLEGEAFINLIGFYTDIISY